jgi:hypothetical protein
MQRPLRVFFGFLSSAIALYAFAAFLTFGHPEGLRWGAAFVRFLILAAALGSSVAAWGTGVFIAYVHRVRWPFLLMTSTIATAGVLFATFFFFQ